MKRHLLIALVCAGCAGEIQQSPDDSSLADLALTELHPALLLPSSQIDLVGASFVDSSRGMTTLRLTGTFTPAGGAGRAVDVRLPVTFVDASHLSTSAGDQLARALGAGTGRFAGQASVLVDSPFDRATHATAPLPVSLDVAPTLAPTVTTVTGGRLFLNGGVLLAGDGLLLGTAEGATHVVLDGCFQPDGASDPCAVPVVAVDLIAQPAAPWDRQHAVVSFTPAIAGIFPGSFHGTVTVHNQLAGGDGGHAGPLTLDVALSRPKVASIAPTAGSLGQFVDVFGGGFVGAADDEVTLLHLVGTFDIDGAGDSARPVDLELVPRFVDGAHARYVLDEADALGQVIDLRRVTGRFNGQATPIVRKATDEVTGDAAAITFAIQPVKQVVYIHFLSSYVDSLRLFGLQAADAAVRARIFADAARDYQGVNIEFRADPPDDFAQFSEVDVAGPDPNGLDLLGYDNTPGKDVGNERLFDTIGGVNATTQSDGFPGYGGIFTEQFLGFSAHPGPSVQQLPVDSNLFDQLFDPVRPETGRPVTTAEAKVGIPALASGTICPADARDRQAVLACAVFVMGNLVGTTLTHEVGHSLGLADPTGELFHDPGDEPNRLMDAGGGRPFEERAELVGQGPALFCDDEYVYLRTILVGASTPDPCWRAHPVSDRP